MLIRTRICISFWILILCILITFGFACKGYCNFNKWFSFNGFGTIALTSSDSDILGFRRTFSTETPVFKNSVQFRTDSRLGTQFTIHPNDNIKGIFQFIIKDSSDQDLDNLIQFAYLDINLTPSFSFRIGRNPLDIFLLSDYRDVGFAYLWARPVTGIYSTLFYDYYEGAELRYVKEVGKGFLLLKSYIGTLDADIPLERYKDIDFSFEPLYGFNLRYDRSPFAFIFGYQKGCIDNISNQFTHLSNLWNIINLNSPKVAYIANQVDINTSYSEYFILGASYEDGPWMIQSEISRYKFEKALNLNYYSGYLSIGYRMKQVTPFVVVSKIYNTLNCVSLSKDILRTLSPMENIAYDLLIDIMDDVDANQTTLSLGLRWNLHSNCALKFQWDHSLIAEKQTTFWKMAQGSEMTKDEKVNIFSISLDFFF